MNQGLESPVTSVIKDLTPTTSQTSVLNTSSFTPPNHAGVTKPSDTAADPPIIHNDQKKKEHIQVSVY